MKKYETQTTRWSRDPARRNSRGLLWGILWLVGLLLSGCGDSGPSGPSAPPDFRYEPDLGELQLTILNSQFFKVEIQSNSPAQVDWYVDGEKKRDGAGFNYFPSTVGVDTVRAEVRVDGYEDSREWLVRVLATEDSLPPEVAGITIEDADDPGEVLVRWLRVVNSPHPVSDYLVAASYQEPVSAANWDAAILLGTVPHAEGTLQYSGIYDLEDGRQVWVAVRARDELEQLSDITNVYDHLVSYPWTLGVQVHEVGGEPVSEVILRWEANGVSYQGNTPFNGFLEIGPFRSVDTVRFETRINNGAVLGDYYDFLNPAVSVDEGADLDVPLIPRHAIDDNCTVSTWGGEFLPYLLYLTTTEFTYALRPTQALWHWDHYPLNVYVPAALRDSDGLDLRQTALMGIQSWNTVMGEDYFEVVDTLEEADVFFEFEFLTGAYGKAELVLPAGRSNFPDSVIPELTRVIVNSEVETTQEFVQSTVMHELGHVLGIYSHAPSDCADAGYLMYSTPGSSPSGPNGGIHPDEQLVAKVIRYLPQGMDMSRYVLE